jgi:tetratricopeptide (TPR) repeat protein
MSIRVDGAPTLRRLTIRTALAGMLGLLGPAAAAAPERPADDALVLAVVAPGRADAAAEMRVALAALAREPGDLALALDVARRAIAEGRASADPRRYGQAQAALAPWWSDPEPPEKAHVLRAVIRQALHDFQGALADLDATLARSPGNGQARLSRAFVRMVVGDLAGAAEDCRAIPRQVGILPAASCRARADALAGEAERGYLGLARALDLDDGAEPAIRRFALLVLADIAAGRGRLEEAGQWLAEAAKIGPADVPLLVAIADHDLETGRAAEVLPLLDGRGDADVLLLRRAIAARRIGDPRLAEWSAILNERFAAASAAGATLHLREEARFRLEVEGDAGAALPLALENWRTQKEPADARLVLQAAHAAGEPETAGDVLRFIRDAGWNDARLAPLVQQIEEPRS